MREVSETLRKKSFWISAGALVARLARTRDHSRADRRQQRQGHHRNHGRCSYRSSQPSRRDRSHSRHHGHRRYAIQRSKQARQLVVDGDADYGLIESGLIDSGPIATSGGQLTILQRTEGANVIVPIIQEVHAPTCQRPRSMRRQASTKRSSPTSPTSPQHRWKSSTPNEAAVRVPHSASPS